MTDAMRRRTPGTAPGNTHAPDPSAWKLADNPARTTIGLLVAGIAALIVFRLFPMLDVWATGLFYAGEACLPGPCEAFPMSVDPFWNAVREIGMGIPRALIVVVVVWLLWSLLWPARKRAATIAAPLLAAISGLLAPLLIVNLILKELWGRPRPYQTDGFGGDGVYVAPGTISDQCESNCSFVSGEASGAFWLLWIVFIVPRPWRQGVFAVLMVFATGVSVLRVAFGRHYLSDITLSAFITVACVTGTVWALQSAAGRRMVNRLAAWSNARAYR